MKLRSIPLNLFKNYFKNLMKIKMGKEVLNPYFATLYLTLGCNYACAFCDDGSAKHKYPELKMKQLNTKDMKRLLKIIRKVSPSIYFTGGEPYLRPDLLELCKYSKKIGFNPVSVNTNGSLMRSDLKVLDYIDNLVISLSTTNCKKYAKTIQRPEKFFEITKGNILLANKLKKKKKFELTINCVVTNDSIKDAENVMNFCFENKLNFAIVPAMVGVYPDKKLKSNKKYKELIKKIVMGKKKGEPVFNSYKYLEIIKDFKKFKCYPLLTPHFYPDGSLFYPCQLLKTKVNLLKIGDYWKAIKEGQKKFGNMPCCDNRCHLACYIEPAIISESLLNLRYF